MKSIVKILLFLLTVLFLLQCEKDEPIPNVTIPDNNFLNTLIELGIDTNGDGEISTAEAEVITTLDVDRESITDLTGIEAFVNLDSLSCNLNYLTELDVSNNTALKYLNCYTNQLNNLDVTNNTALLSLGCSTNQLSSLDVSNNTKLVSLNCQYNQLTTLDVSNNTALLTLFCDNNQLTTLDVSNNTALYLLWCGSNQLTRLNISNNVGLTDLRLELMPSLYEVCVRGINFPPWYVYVNKFQSLNVFFTNECTAGK